MQTIGERLEEARKKKGVSIREAAEATKVRGEYLQKFEANQFDIGLGDLYVRGFLRSYSVFLKLSPDRILTDFAALGHGEARPRQPSREVYGRMDLSIGSPEDGGQGGEAAPDGGAKPPVSARQDGGQGSRPLHQVQRSRAGTPMDTGINQALVFKGLIACAGVVILLLLLWAVKAIVGGGPAASEAVRPAAIVSAPAQRVPDATVAIVGVDDIRIKVVRQSDGVELYQGPLARGERREFENVPLYLTASALENVAIEYKGKRYPTGLTGRNRVAVDLSTR
jgi:hypothetical protein